MHLAEVLPEAGDGSGLGGGGEGRGLHGPEIMAQAEVRRKHPERETRGRRRAETSVQHRPQEPFLVDGYEDLVLHSPEPVARLRLPLVVRNLVDLATKLEPVAWLVGGGDRPHPGLVGRRWLLRPGGITRQNQREA